ncbi:COP1-interacting protein 4.1 [Melia azedarach]|uniref:COP1-interacting protein 4.1 n=1 Tax=Melia azedarach TaxID=155640 RepID=A0ACC1YQ07_MELAZ|nr:COP1-interacting protein 4.1 [Melia azedarach]
MRMASSSEEVAVFTDTNLGTRIAMAVSPGISVGDFKKLERTHFSCFPRIGEIKVCGLLVKRKASFYHLPNSMPIKHVFQGLKGTWFLHVEAKPLLEMDGSGLCPCIDAKVRDHNVIVSNATNSLITDTEKNGIISLGEKGRINGSCGSTPLPKEHSRTVSLVKRKRNREKRVEYAVACNSSPLAEIPSERASSNFSEMRKFGSPPGKTEVGRRLVKASKIISISACKTSPTISLCRFKNGKLLHNGAASLAQYSVFEISDNDD